MIMNMIINRLKVNIIVKYTDKDKTMNIYYNLD